MIQVSRIGIVLTWIQLVMTTGVLVAFLGLIIITPDKYQIVPLIFILLVIPILLSKNSAELIRYIMFNKLRNHEQKPPERR